jgi:hypothetical protein
MKKLLMVMFLATISLVGISQTGFFKPVPSNLFENKYKVSAEVVTPSVWLFRPSVAITAIQLNWNKATKGFDASALNSAGLGVGYQHYVEVNGVPYNNYGFNILLLLGADIEQKEPASVSFAGTVSLLEWVNLGVVYNITAKQVGILTGVRLKF